MWRWQHLAACGYVSDHPWESERPVTRTAPLLAHVDPPGMPGAAFPTLLAIDGRRVVVFDIERAGTL
jgi:hypothetical protein